VWTPIPHDKKYHRSPTLPDDDEHKTATPIDHPDASIRPSKLDAVNTPVDGQAPVFDAATERFRWASAGGAWRVVKDIQIMEDTPLPYTMDGLDGDSEQIHHVIAFIYLSDYGNSFLRPNGQTANTTWGGIYYTQTGYGTEYGNTQGYFLSRHDGATYPCLTELLLRAKTGTPRGGHGQYAELGYSRGGSNFSWWNETTTNITSYVIQSSPTGRSLRAGSRIIIYSL
jgi:hypothetical protein